MKARAVVGRGEKNLLCEPGPELLSFSMEEEREEKNVRRKYRWDEKKKTIMKHTFLCPQVLYRV